MHLARILRFTDETLVNVINGISLVIKSVIIKERTVCEQYRPKVYQYS